MKIVRTEIRSFYSRTWGWVARKVFYTNGSTHYSLNKRGYGNKETADATAKMMEWKSHR